MTGAADAGAGVDVVLVEPREPGNVGAAARAMGNMGLGRLLLVNPADHLASDAYRLALGAKTILEEAVLFGTLAEALEGAGFVLGTTRREGKVRAERVTPRRAAAEVAARLPDNRCAIVFGREESGLTNEEIRLCQRLVTIPTTEESRSLNLSQAVLVLAYEIRLALAGSGDECHITPSRKAAPHEVVEGLYGHMEKVLLEIGYLHPDNPAWMMGTFRRIFARADLDGREVRALRGIFHQMEWYAENGSLPLRNRPDVDKQE